MSNRFFLVLVSFLFSLAPSAAQSPRPMTLRQAVRLALAQNPDVLLARIEREKAESAVAVAKGASSPMAYVGSGLGWSEGIPQTIEGAAPSIVQGTARMPIYNAAQRKRVQEAEAGSEAGAHALAAREDEIAYEAARSYLDFELAARRVDLLADRREDYRRIERTVEARVEEGRAIPLDLSRARLDSARAEQAVRSAESEKRLTEAALASRLGLGAGARIEPVPSEPLAAAPLPESAETGASRALENSSELKGLTATVRSKELSVEAEKGASKPRLDFVAQYSLLARFNNYDDFFRRFQRHNGQVGLALQVPVFTGRSVSSRVAQARIETREAELQLAARRAGVELESYELFHAVEQARAAGATSKLELDFARESLSVVLARFEEGRIPLDEVERARAQESAAWERYYEARYDIQKTELNLLRRTGELAAALR